MDRFITSNESTEFVLYMITTALKAWVANRKTLRL